MMRLVTIGSLFSGIGGLELGLECALRDGGFDVETVFQCEADAWCRSILAHHWPSAVRYDDVRGVGPDAPRVDVLCGGFPCQDVSSIGRGAGLRGERSGLWFEFARIVRELRPRIVVVENVAMLVSRGLDEVLGSLAASGYDAVWFPVRASDVGAPHRRERIFVVAWRRVEDADEARRGEAAADEFRVGRLPTERAGEAVAHRAGEFSEGCVRVGSPRVEPARTTGNGSRGGSTVADTGEDGLPLCDAASPPTWPTPERGSPSRGRLNWREPTQRRVGGDADGLPAGMDLAAHRWPVGPDEAQPEGEPPRVAKGVPMRRQRIGALGNAVVPQVGYVVGCVVARALAERWGE